MPWRSSSICWCHLRTFPRERRGSLPYPVAKEDLALIVDDDVPAEPWPRRLRRGGGELVESVRLFDIYVGEQLAAGKRSLAFAIRLRAPDRTLTSRRGRPGAGSGNRGGLAGDRRCLAHLAIVKCIRSSV